MPDKAKNTEQFLHPELKVTFLAVGPFIWGKGATPEEAFKQLKRANSGRVPKEGYLLKTPDPEAYINGMGGATFAQDPEDKPGYFKNQPVKVAELKRGLWVYVPH